ncbi:MAG: GntR family transcriptional regulator, partial [Pseudomonadota bacterium]
KIEEMIVSGTVRPGARLDEVSLATRFGVSRTPIREALLTLAAAGLIELRPHRGAIVSQFSEGRLAEMVEVMAEFEAICARRAALHAGSAALNAVRESLARCASVAATGDRNAYYYENEALHEAIDAASMNAFLSEQTRALRRRVKPYRRIQLRVSGRLETSMSEHEAIVAAIEAGDAEAASAAMLHHVRVQGDHFNEIYNDATASDPELAMAAVSGRARQAG